MHINRSPKRYKYYFYSLYFLVIAWVIRTTIFRRRRDTDQFLDIDAFAIIQIAIIIIAIIVIITAPKVTIRYKYLLRTSLGAIVIYYLFSTMSALWSPIPIFSAYRAIEALVMISAIYVALSYKSDFYDAERAVIIIAFTVILLDFYQYIRDGLPSDIWPLHTNSYSAMAAMIFCYSIGEYLKGKQNKRKIFLKNTAVVSFLFVVIGTSAASNISAFLGLVVVFLISRDVKIYFILFFIGLSVMLMEINQDFIREIFFPGKTEESIKHATGRVNLWNQYYDTFKENPIIGQGFAVTARLSDLYAQSTHSSFYSVLVGTGIIGMIICLLGILRWFRETGKTLKYKSPGTVGCIGGIVAGVINASGGLPFIADQWMPTSVVFYSVISLFILFCIPRMQYLRNYVKTLNNVQTTRIEQY